MSYLQTTSWFDSPSLPSSSAYAPTCFPAPAPTLPPQQGVLDRSVLPTPLPVPSYPSSSPATRAHPLSPPAPRRRAPSAPRFAPRRPRLRHIPMPEPARSGLFTVSEETESDGGQSAGYESGSTAASRSSRRRVSAGWGAAWAELGAMGSARASSEALVPSPLVENVDLPVEGDVEAGTAVQGEDVVMGMQTDLITPAVGKRASVESVSDKLSLLAMIQSEDTALGKRLSWSSLFSNTTPSPRYSNASTADSEGAATPMQVDEADDPFFVDVPLGIDEELEMDRLLPSRRLFDASPIAVAKGVPLEPVAAVRVGSKRSIKRPPPLDLRRAAPSSSATSSRKPTCHPYAYAATRSIHDWADQVDVLTPKPLPPYTPPATQTVLLPPLPILSPSEYRQRTDRASSPPISPAHPAPYLAPPPTPYTPRTPRTSSRRALTSPVSASIPAFGCGPQAPRDGRRKSHSSPAAMVRQTGGQGETVDLVSALESLLASCGEPEGVFDIDLSTSAPAPAPALPRSHRFAPVSPSPGVDRRFLRPPSVPSSAISSDEDDDGNDDDDDDMPLRLLQHAAIHSASVGRMTTAFPLPPPRTPRTPALALSPSLSTSSSSTGTASSFTLPSTPQAPARHSSLPPLHFHTSPSPAFGPGLDSPCTPAFPSAAPLASPPPPPTPSPASRRAHVKPMWTGDHSFLWSMSRGENEDAHRPRQKGHEREPAQGAAGGSWSSSSTASGGSGGVGDFSWSSMRSSGRGVDDSLGSAASGGKLPPRSPLPTEWLQQSQSRSLPSPRAAISFAVRPARRFKDGEEGGDHYAL